MGTPRIFVVVTPGYVVSYTIYVGHAGMSLNPTLLTQAHALLIVDWLCITLMPQAQVDGTAASWWDCTLR